MWIKALFLLLMLPWAAGAVIVQPTNTCAWHLLAGLKGVGGIPATVDYASVPASTDTTAMQALINAASVAAGPGVVNRLNLTNATFSWGALTLKSNVLLQGRGADYSAAGTKLAMSGAFFYQGPSTRTTDTIAGGATRGSDAIVLSSVPTTLAVGDLIWVTELNDPNYVSPTGWETDVGSAADYLGEPDATAVRIRAQGVTVASIQGKVVRFSPPLEEAYPNTPRAEWVTTHGLIGLADLIVSNAVGVMFRMEFAHKLWWTNVFFDIGANDQSAISTLWTKNVEIRHCKFEGWNAGASAVVPYVKNEAWLVEDNIFKRVNQSFVVVGSGGRHKFSYNYTESITNGTTSMTAEIGGHGGHPSKVYIVGNVIWHFLADAIHGTGDRWVLLRNQVMQRATWSTYGHGGIWTDQTNYWGQYVGNVLGYPGISHGGYGWTEDLECTDGTTPPPSTVIDWRWGFAGYNAQAIDPFCKSSAVKHGNYSHLAGAVQWDAGISDHTVPDDLVDPDRPECMRGLPWPAIGPDVAGYVRTWANAAHYRDANGGADPPLAGKFSVLTAGVKTSRARVTR